MARNEQRALSEDRARFVYGSRAHVPDYMVLYPSQDVYRLITDQLGNVRLVVKVSDGSVAQRIDYDEWGNATAVTGAEDFQPLGFAGGLHDHETGWCGLGLGTILQLMSKETNLAAYASNDPVNTSASPCDRDPNI